MLKPHEYQERANECRLMADRTRSTDQRQMLLSMASAWESLAMERLKRLARQMAEQSSTAATRDVGRDQIRRKI
jgi:hypothetical protein